VVYPGETRLIGKLIQIGVEKGTEGIPTSIMPIIKGRIVKSRWVCEELKLICEVSSEGSLTRTIEQTVSEDSFIADVTHRG
jgi:hypothetical protein